MNFLKSKLNAIIFPPKNQCYKPLIKFSALNLKHNISPPLQTHSNNMWNSKSKWSRKTHIKKDISGDKKQSWNTKPWARLKAHTSWPLSIKISRDSRNSASTGFRGLKLFHVGQGRVEAKLLKPFCSHRRRWKKYLIDFSF